MKGLLCSHAGCCRVNECWLACVSLIVPLPHFPLMSPPCLWLMRPSSRQCALHHTARPCPLHSSAAPPCSALPLSPPSLFCPATHPPPLSSAPPLSRPRASPVLRHCPRAQYCWATGIQPGGVASEDPRVYMILRIRHSVNPKSMLALALRWDTLTRGTLRPPNCAWLLAACRNPARHALLSLRLCCQT